jgi:SAM-dependent methyltransferase
VANLTQQLFTKNETSMRDPVTEPAADPRWGQRDRDIKAHAIAQTLRHYMSLPLDQVDCVDIGCGSGGIAFHLAPLVRSMVGVDPESWQRWKDFQNQRKNLQVSSGVGRKPINSRCQCRRGDLQSSVRACS